MLVAQSCTTLCDSTDYSPPVSSVHGILQARILEWVAISSSRNGRDSFPAQGSNPGLLHCRRILYPLISWPCSIHLMAEQSCSVQWHPSANHESVCFSSHLLAQLFIPESGGKHGALPLSLTQSGHLFSASHPGSPSSPCPPFSPSFLLPFPMFIFRTSKSFPSL